MMCTRCSPRPDAGELYSYENSPPNPLIPRAVPRPFFILRCGPNDHELLVAQGRHGIDGRSTAGGRGAGECGDNAQQDGCAQQHENVTGTALRPPREHTVEC